MKNLVIFDLDDTLLGADSEFHFTKFIVEKGMLDKNFYLKKIKAFDADARDTSDSFISPTPECKIFILISSFLSLFILCSNASFEP